MTTTTRRDFLRNASTLAVVGAVSGAGLATTATTAQAYDKPEGSSVEGVKALIFDVFGTLVDWRTCVARESKKILAPLGYQIDWIAFADAWRAEYQPGMEEIRSGRQPFSRLDVVHRGMLERIRPRFGLEKLDEPVLANLNLVWHRLDAWKDVGPGFRMLRRKFLLAPCSNGNISLMVDLARRNNIHWDAILGAEIAGDYKPKLRVYQAAAEALGIKPSECMMVAAHSDDLKFAAAAGLRTGHVAKLNEFGPNTGEPGPKVPVDAAAPDMVSFAKLLKA
jgi:2-haloacid dehalogenase